jgi:hypothetical protein
MSECRPEIMKRRRGLGMEFEGGYVNWEGEDEKKEDQQKRKSSAGADVINDGEIDTWKGEG